MYWREQLKFELFSEFDLFILDLHVIIESWHSDSKPTADQVIFKIYIHKDNLYP